MSGALTPIGSLTISQVVPFLASAQSQVNFALNVAVPALKAQIKGLLAAQVQLATTPPSISGNAKIAAAVAASIKAPQVGFKISFLVKLLASLQATLGALQAQITLAGNVAATLGAPGIAAYSFTGITGELGTLMSALTSAGLPIGNGPNDQCNALVLACTTFSTKPLMASVFVH